MAGRTLDPGTPNFPGHSPFNIMLSLDSKIIENRTAFFKITFGLILFIDSTNNLPQHLPVAKRCVFR